MIPLVQHLYMKLYMRQNNGIFFFYCRHNNEVFRGGYGYHRPDYRGDHSSNRDPRIDHNRDPRVEHNRDPRVDHNRDPRGEHRKHYQRSEQGNHAPRPPDDRWEDRFVNLDVTLFYKNKCCN